MLARVLAVLFLYVGSGSAAVSCSSHINPLGTFSTTVAVSNLNGCLKIGGGGLLANSSSSPWNDFFVAWSIKSLGTSNWQYNYTFSDPTSEGTSSNIAYLLLGVSPTCGTASQTQFKATVCIGNVTGTTIDPSQAIPHSQLDAPKTWTGAGPPPNPGLIAPLYALKLDNTSSSPTINLAFDSTRRPVWQDFYANASSNGQGAYVYNAGFGIGKNAGFFLAAPDTEPGAQNVTPEPSFFVLMLGGIVATYFTQKRHSI